MKSTRLACAALLLAGSTLLLGGQSFAQVPHGGHGPGGGRPHFTFVHRDFGHFTPAEHASWIGGRWNHGWHNGRYGWWWFAGGAWYFYDAPVYPYPAYVSDYYVDDEGDYGPGYGPPNQYWYYCSSPPGYYPYVRTCATPWQPVPAGPPPQAYGPGPAPGGPPPAYQQGPGPGAQPPPGEEGTDQGPPPAGPPGYPPPEDQPPPPPPNGYNGGDGPH